MSWTLQTEPVLAILRESSNPLSSNELIDRLGVSPDDVFNAIEDLVYRGFVKQTTDNPTNYYIDTQEHVEFVVNSMVIAFLSPVNYDYLVKNAKLAVPYIDAVIKHRETELKGDILNEKYIREVGDHLRKYLS